jgi:hypothetical protein
LPHLSGIFSHNFSIRAAGKAAGWSIAAAINAPETNMAYREDPAAAKADTRDGHAARPGDFPSGPFASFGSLAEAIAIAAYPVKISPRHREPDRAAILTCLGVFLLIFSSKLLLIQFASSPVPFYDEWDAEAANVIKPFTEGRLGIGTLFGHDNEHLIFFTRLVTILGLKISGYWDVVLAMIFNAFLHSAILALLLAALSRALDGAKATAAMLLGCSVAVLPFGHENALLGFNTHFYTLMAFSLAALWLFAAAEAWSLRWCFGVLLATGAFLSMASGALAPATAAGMALVQIRRGARSGLKEWLGMGALFALAALFIALTPHVPENDVFRARSISAFLSGFVQLLAWPIPFGIGALLYVPGLAFAYAVTRQAPRRDDPRWFNLGVLAWTLSQLSALAFGRNEILVSRYLDFCVVGVFVNLVSALWLATWLNALDGRRNIALLGKVALLALAVSMILALAMTINHGRVVGWGAILERRESARIQEVKLRSYISTGDSSALGGNGLHDLPYPSAVRLKALLDDPTIRSTLPPIINPGQHVRPIVEEIKSHMLTGWWAFFAAGLLCLSLSRRSFRRS